MRHHRHRLYAFLCGFLIGTAAGVVLVIARIVFFTHPNIL
jgi:hypothetical protein